MRLKYFFQFTHFDGQIFGCDAYLNWVTIYVEATAEPYPTLAILGGAFLASKAFLSSIDYFGRGMLGWGNENMEIGIKVRKFENSFNLIWSPSIQYIL